MPASAAGRGPVYHGGFSRREAAALGLRFEEIIDFSVNSNPFGPPPAVVDAVRQASLTAYPEPDALTLREALAGQLGLGPESVIAGNGSVEIIWLAARAFLRRRDHALVLGPTFGEYAAASRAAGARICHCEASEASGFQPDLNALATVLKERCPRLAFICNPNNPTGVLLPAMAIGSIVTAFPDTLFVVDEAYLSLSGGCSALQHGLRENLLVLRSMTKDCAIPGLRLGYAAGPEHVIRRLRAQQPPWSVNALAQAAGLAAAREPSYARRCLSAIAEARAYLMSALAALGLHIEPSAANFFLVRVEDAAAFRLALLRRGCCVRDCASFGLPNHVRIAVRTLPECERLVAVATDWLQGDR